MELGAWPNAAAAQRDLVSFDGGLRAVTAVQRPDRYGFLRPSNAARPAIARGGGLSFAAASFGAAAAVSVEMGAFDRVLGFDGTTGEVEVEAGVTLGALFAFLEPRGFYLPVQPGYPGITVGGCIAGDVHGKNAARDGTFISQVLALRLFHPTHGTVEASPAQEPELFRATCGGFGLTGVIVSARLRAVRLEGNAVEARRHAVDGLLEGAGRLAGAGYDFAFGWHDLTRGGSAFGRGVVTECRLVMAARAPAGPGRGGEMTAAGRGRLPAGLLNGVSARVMNAAYRQSLRGGSRVMGLYASMFPFHGREAYYQLYGRGGFHESQVIVPLDQFGAYCEGLQAAVAQTGAVVCFAALKLFAGASDMVRFDGAGASLAIHMARGPAASALLEQVDRLTVALGGRPNALKDSRLPRAVFDASYPEADRFRRFIGAWDGKRVFRSALSERLGL